MGPAINIGRPASSSTFSPKLNTNKELSDWKLTALSGIESVRLRFSFICLQYSLYLPSSPIAYIVIINRITKLNALLIDNLIFFVGLLIDSHTKK